MLFRVIVLFVVSFVVAAADPAMTNAPASTNALVPAVVAPITNAPAVVSAPEALTNSAAATNATTTKLTRKEKEKAEREAAVAQATADVAPPVYQGPFPRPLDSYDDEGNHDLGTVLATRAFADSFNFIALIIFLLAIVHTFLAPRILAISRRMQESYEDRLRARLGADQVLPPGRQRQNVPAAVLHFFGEVEVVFGLWAIPLGVVMLFSKGAETTRHYFDSGVSYIEPLFVVVIMAIAASRPVVVCAEKILGLVAGQSPVRWWFALMTIGPLLGSLITEPAAMTITALLLGREFYRLGPTPTFMYATLGLLFVNVSVGGALTTFAAPPVLIVAAKWHWTTLYMLENFGWRVLAGIVICNVAYFLIFRKQFEQLGATREGLPPDDDSGLDPVPVWITLVHIAFLAFTVDVAHEPALFIGGFLFFLGFVTATAPYQHEINLRPPMLVGFFLAGLVIHGGLQGWWIQPLLSRMGELQLLFGSAFLTAFNDNAAITYLATLVPNLGPTFKLAVVSGAIAGGGLTVIANAPNPAGQSLLQEHFPDGIAPGKLLLAALFPTAVMLALFCVPR